MKWIPRLLVLFIVVPALELVLLLQFSRWTSFWATVALIVGTGVLGGFAARHEGLGAWRRLQARLGHGEIPGVELVDAVIILIAGILLVTPGLLSDLAGLIGLFPPTRTAIRRFALRRFEKGRRQGSIRFHAASPFGAPAPPDEPSWQGTPRHTPENARPPENERRPPSIGDASEG